jgi:LmbE family N-acetylglucosaminyl deacetylase
VQRQYQAIFISPHLDDAVFSCGGLIAKLIQAKEPVLIVNIFSENPEQPNRRQEESEVAKYLNLDVLYLAEFDAIYRHPSYKSLLHLFSRIEPSDRGRLPDLADKLRKLLDGIHYEAIYLPLGIGWHVDHLLTFELGQRIADRQKLRFYEDTPYCLLPQFTEHRLQQFSAGLVARNSGAARAAGQALMSMAPTQKFAWSPFRFLIQWVITLWFWAVLRRQRSTLEQPHELAAELIDVEAQLPKKIDACRLYKSQFSEFYLDAADCEKHLRKYAERIGGETRYVERYWRTFGAPE